MTAASPYHIPQEPKRLHAIGLAALVHFGLFAFLWLGINWQNEKPIAIEAEIWNMPPAPKPLPSPEKPTPALTPPKQTISEKTAPAINPNIALEQTKKRQAEEKSRMLKQKIAQEKEKAEKLAAEKMAADKRKQAEEERVAKLKIEAEKQKKARSLKLEQELAAQNIANKTRDDEMHRIANAINTGNTGRIDVPKSNGNKRGDPSYIQMIAAKIKSNTQFYLPADVTSNNPAEYKIELFPDGSLRGLPQKLKSSGIPGFDEAVRRAIEKSVPLPPDNSGTVPSSLTVTHRPKD